MIHQFMDFFGNASRFRLHSPTLLSSPMMTRAISATDEGEILDGNGVLFDTLPLIPSPR